MRYALALLLFASAAFGQSVKMPADVNVPVGRLASIQIQYEGKSFQYLVVGGQVDAFREYEPTPGVVRLRIVGYAPCEAHVVAIAAEADRAAVAQCTVTVGEPTPPIPPVPPGPTPIPTEGLHVLVVYETADLSTLPRAQMQVLTSGAVRDYLNQKCVKGPDGKTAEWRIWDKDVDAKNESKFWQDVMARKRDKLPWLYVSNGKAVYEGPLPGTIDETLALLRKFGG